MRDLPPLAGLRVTHRELQSPRVLHSIDRGVESTPAIQDRCVFRDVQHDRLIFDLDAVAGESYKGLTLKRGGGELTVKTKSGDSIALKYQATKD